MSLIKMKKEIGNVNQFEEASFLEIFYNESDKVIKFNFRKEKYCDGKKRNRNYR